MTGLILSFLTCVSMTGIQVENCVPILDEIVEVEDNNPYDYVIGIKGFDYYSDANLVANYWYYHSSGNLDMIATFMAESMFNKDAIGKAGERGICQLYPNRTNLKWINDPRRADIMYQAEVCLDKWNAVPNPSKIRYGWKGREKQKKQIYYFE